LVAAVPFGFHLWLAFVLGFELGIPSTKKTSIHTLKSHCGSLWETFVLQIAFCSIILHLLLTFVVQKFSQIQIQIQIRC
jgi:uncharacterized protein (DUF2062 family)